MKKKVFFLSAIILLISLCLPSYSENKMEEFGKLLTGKWKKIDWAGPTTTSSGFGSKSFGSGTSSESEAKQVLYRNNFRNIDSFVYPENNRSSAVFLTEDATGAIYLIVLNNNSQFCVGKIAFNDNGTILLVMSAIDESMAIYEKIK